MTTPNQARQRSSNGPRTYAWPPLPPHEFEVVSVTSALNSLPKPFLLPWAVKMTAERAVDKYEFLGAMIKEDEKGAIKWLKDARFGDAGAKADRGTIVHGALEAYLAGKPVTEENIEAQLRAARVPTALGRSTGNMIAGLMEFLVDEEPEVYWSESTVYSRTHGYAGTPDLVCRMRVGGKLKPVVVDVKTSKSIYDEVSLQTCAYARADFVGLDDGTEAPLTPTGEPIEHGVVVRPKPGGGYEKAVFTHTDRLFDLFLSVLAVTTGQDELARVRRPA